MCLNSWDNLTVVHLAAIIFGLTYAIFVPVFFVLQINQGVSAVDKLCGIEVFRTDVKRKKEELKIIKKVDEEKLEAT